MQGVKRLGKLIMVVFVFAASLAWGGVSFAGQGNQQAGQQYGNNRDAETQNFPERKQRMLQMINERIEKLTNAKSCVQAAQPGQP